MRLFRTLSRPFLVAAFIIGGMELWEHFSGPMPRMVEWTWCTMGVIAMYLDYLIVMERLGDEEPPTESTE